MSRKTKWKVIDRWLWERHFIKMKAHERYQNEYKIPGISINKMRDNQKPTNNNLFINLGNNVRRKAARLPFEEE